MFQIGPHLRYPLTGSIWVYLGPHASTSVWEALISKWRVRDIKIAQSGMNHVLAVLNYNARAMPVQGYVG